MNTVIGALRVSLGLDSAEFDSGSRRVKQKGENLAASLRTAFAAIGGVAAFAALTAGIGQAVGRLEEARKLTAQLDRALLNTGNTARTSGSEIAEFADKLERSTGRAAEEVLAVSTNLATFGFSREVFFDAIKLADDMSAAWGGDLKQNVEGLARALADPEKGLAMLTKRGITFTDQQKAMIASFMRANDIIGAQGVVMDALNEQVKGVAAAGFTGLTKAQANARLAMEGFFEMLANGLGINLGIELGLIAVAGALDVITSSAEGAGRYIAIAGAALLGMAAPAVIAGLGSVISLIAGPLVAGLRAVNLALMANPILGWIGAISAVVAALFLFRDEIHRVLGVDVVGVVQEVTNRFIGLFVGAYEAVKQAWGNLPTFFGGLGKQAWNSFVAEFEKPALTVGGQTIIPGLDLSSFKAQLSQAEQEAFGQAAVTFDRNFLRDYVSEWSGAITGLGSTATATQAALAALNDEAGDSGTKGAMSGAKAATDDFSKSLQDASRWGDQLSSSLASGFTNMFMGVIDGTKSVAQSFGDMFRNIGQQFLQSGLQNLFGNLLGGLFGGGGQWGMMGGFAGFPGMFGLPSFDGGGFTWTGPRTGGLDGKGGRLAMLHPNETVLDHSKGQGGASRLHITTGVAVDGQGSISSYVKSVVQDGIEIFNEALPDRVQQINADPRAR